VTEPTQLGCEEVGISIEFVEELGAVDETDVMGVKELVSVEELE
jgi:hypothetical protein